MEPRVICIYHSRDLDGWCSAAIVKKKFPKVKLIGWDYGDKPPYFPDCDKLILVDVYTNDQHIIMHLGAGKEVIWIDHHKSAIKEALYHFNDDKRIVMIYDVEKAACELTWEYFFPNEKIPEQVELLGLYDSFRHKTMNNEIQERVMNFQYAARAFISNPEECYSLFFVDFVGVPNWISSGFSIYKYLKTIAKQDYQRGFQVIIEGHKFVMVNAVRFNPINFGINYHKHGYDGAGCFWFRNGKWEFSLYNDNGKVDVSEICKAKGGGGHAGAAGFVKVSIDWLFEYHTEHN